MSVAHYTINKNTGTFVAGRRSARLAAKRGEVTIPFTPRVERYPAITPAAPVGVAQRRTSPRLAPMYAKKTAVQKAKAEALRLVDEVLAYAKKAAATQKVKGFTIFYDAVGDRYITTDNPSDEATNLDEVRAAFYRFADVVKPLVEAGQSGGPQKATAAMVATFDHPDLGTVLRGARVLPSLGRFRGVLEKKVREFADHPEATPTLRLVSAEILRKYYS
jgi:hypothetical protein